MSPTRAGGGAGTGRGAADVAPVRSFVAIELDGAAADAVRALLARLRRSDADVAWTAATNLHCTLKFLGAVAPARLDALAERLRGVAAAYAPFTLVAAGIGGFPSLLRPRVLWVGVDAPALPPLAAAVDAAAGAEGVAPERRHFHGHVTLGRVREARRRRAGGAGRGRGGVDMAALLAAAEIPPDVRFGEATARELVLFRSVLGPRGARYEPLARLALGG